MSEGIRPRRLPVPPAMSDEDAALDASIRWKTDRHEPLDAAERAFLARLPAHKEIPPGAVKDAYEGVQAPARGPEDDASFDRDAPAVRGRARSDELP